MLKAKIFILIYVFLKIHDEAILISPGLIVTSRSDMFDYHENHEPFLFKIFFTKIYFNLKKFTWIFYIRFLKMFGNVVQQNHFEKAVAKLISCINFLGVPLNFSD